MKVFGIVVSAPLGTVLKPLNAAYVMSGKVLLQGTSIICVYIFFCFLNCAGADLLIYHGLLEQEITLNKCFKPFKPMWFVLDFSSICKNKCSVCIEE